MKLYLSGPMTGYTDFNYPAFAVERMRLRSAGYEVVCPAEHNPEQLGTWDECMEDAFRLLAPCDGVAVFGAWAMSKGACAEVEVAISTHKVVAHVNYWLEKAVFRPMAMQQEAEGRIEGE